MAGVDASSTTAPSAGPSDDRGLADPGAQGLRALKLESATKRAVQAATHGGWTTPIGRRGGRDQRSEDDRQAGAATAASATISTALAMLERDDQAAAVVAVREHAPDRPEDHDRDHPAGGGQRDPGRGPGPLEDERQQRDVVEPVATRRNGEAGSSRWKGRPPGRRRRLGDGCIEHGHSIGLSPIPHIGQRPVLGPQGAQIGPGYLRRRPAARTKPRR